MKTTTPPRVACIAIVALAVASCGEKGAIRTTSSSDGGRAITSQVLIRTEGKSATVTLALDVPGDVEKIGSYTGRLRFDPALLAFESEVEQADGVMRASNPQAGVIRVAGVGRTGIDPAGLAVFRFSVHDAAGLQSLSFDLDELHEVSRSDLRPLVRRGQAPRILK